MSLQPDRPWEDANEMQNRERAANRGGMLTGLIFFVLVSFVLVAIGVVLLLVGAI